MPDFDDNDQYDDGQQGNEPNWRRKLEADAKAGREASAQLAAMQEEVAKAKQAQRELAMHRAGVDITSGVGALFAKAYDGEVDVDQIKSEWEKLNVAPGTPQVGQTNVGISSDQQAAMARISEAAAGAQGSAGVTPDFGSELNKIPELVDGNWNPNFVNDVLTATAAQASREGRQFETSQGQINWQKGAAGPVPAVNPQ